MPSSAVLRHLPKHQGTGRSASMLRGLFSELSPPSLATEKYVLFLAKGDNGQVPTPRHARNWIESGASYICAWGPVADDVERTFDFAGFLPELGTPLSYTLMTTSHARETIEEALWFAFYCASAPDDLEAELNRIVIVAETGELEKQCETWVRTNAE